MKKITVIFTVLAFTSLSLECLAQKVTSHGGYSAVIDNSSLPVGVLKTSTELADQKNQSTGQMNPHKEKEPINQKVSPRFAVSKTDVENDGTSGSEEMTWANALVACAAYKEVDQIANVWRLPTQRELMLISQMKTELQAVDGFIVFTANYYWSSTERSTNSYVSWYVSFGNGGVNGSSKSYDYYVRCVRDL